MKTFARAKAVARAMKSVAEAVVSKNPEELCKDGEVTFEPDYDNMPYKDLKAQAKMLGIKTGRTKKADMVTALWESWNE